MRETKITKFYCYSIIAIAFFYLLSVSWLRWGDLFIDTFRDQWAAYKLTQGKILYQDIVYEYGFLPPCFLAFVFRAFGAHVTHSIYIGIALTLVTAFFTYRTGRLFLNRALSTLLTLHFLFVLAFNASSYVAICNFLLPYSIASTFLIAACMGSLYCFIKYVRTDKNIYVIGWIISLWIAFLSRIDHSVLLWTIYCVLALLFFPRDKKIRFIWDACIVFIVSLVSYLVFLQRHNAFQGFSESFFSYLRFSLSGKNYFARRLSGITTLSTNSAIIITSFFVQAAVLAFLHCLSIILSAARKKYPQPIMAFFSLLVSVACAIAAGCMAARFMRFDSYMPCLIIFIIGAGYSCFATASCAQADKTKHLSLLALFCVSLVLIVRVMFNINPHNQSFFLFVPGLIAYYVVCFELYPLFLSKFIPLSKPRSRSYSLCIAIVVITLAIPFISESHYWFRTRKTLISIPGKINLYFPNFPQTERFTQALAYIAQNTKKHDSIVVFPEGIGINFLAERDNPLPYIQFHPSYIELLGESTVIRLLEENAITYAIITNQPSPEHGSNQFGIGYGREIMSWLVSHYTLETVFGDYSTQTSRFSMAIYKRKPG